MALLFTEQWSHALLLWFLPHEKRQNLQHHLFLVGPTTIKHFYFLNQMVLCMATGNLTCNHVIKQARREGFFDKDKIAWIHRWVLIFNRSIMHTEMDKVLHVWKCLVLYRAWIFSEHWTLGIRFYAAGLYFYKKIIFKWCKHDLKNKSN